MLTDLDDIAAQIPGDGRGGKRPGAGRPKKDGARSSKTPPVKTDIEIRTPDELLADGPPEDKLVQDDPNSDLGAISFVVPTNPGALYAGAKARKEAALAAKAELEFRVKAGLYLPREAIRSALAEAFQTVAQTLRSVPDNLERKLGATPEIAEAVSAAIDEAMGELAYAMEQMHNANADTNKD